MRIRFLAIAILVVCFAHRARGQWTTSGSAVYNASGYTSVRIGGGGTGYQDANGNRFYVYGQLGVGNDTAGEKQILMGYDGTYGRGYLKAYDAVNGWKDLVINDGGGNVGIGVGSSAPGSRLEIKGAGSTSGTSSLHVKNSSATSLLFVRNDGNVGIGTSSPGTKLEVAGQVKITGGSPGAGKVLTSDANGLATWETAPGALPSASTGSTLFYNGSAWVASSTLFNDNAKIGMGTTTPGSRLEIKGTSASSSNSSLHVTDWVSASLLFVRDDGLVGIGTSSPSQKLHVNGVAQATNFYGLSGESRFATASYTDPHSGVGYDAKFGGNGNGIAALGQSYFANRVGVGTNAPAAKLEVKGIGTSSVYAAFHAMNSASTSLFYVRDDGNVGVGTSSPGTRLEVNGSIRGNQSGALRIDSGNGWVDIGAKNTSWAHFYTDRPMYYFDKEIRVDTGYIGTYDEDLALRTGGTTRVTIQNTTGYVGIGTSSPGTNLEINGQVKITGGTPGTGKILTSDASGLASWQDPAPALPSASNGQTLRHNGTSWITNSTLYNDGTNVGIGTSSPGAKLEVAGQIKITGGTPGAGKILTSDASGLASWASPPSSLPSATTGQTMRYDGSTWIASSLVYNDGSRIGIGTTSPDVSYMLSVKGKIRAEEVVVETGWADFVFAEDYRLPPLSEVRRIIRTEKHLPGIPTAAEVKAKGVSVGQMQTRLLQKIEELTLYAIAQQDELQTLRRSNSSQNTELQSMRQYIRLLEDRLTELERKKR